MSTKKNRSDPCIETFIIFSWVRTLFLILLQLDILCTVAVKRYNALNDNSPYRCHKFPVQRSSWKQRKTCHQVIPTPILLWRALQSKLYHQDFWGDYHLKCILLHCWVWHQWAAIEVADRLLRAAMVELCAKIECDTYIDWYFRCTIAYLMQRIYKYCDNQNTSLTPDEKLNILIYWTSSYVIICESYTLLKWPVFL